MPSARFVSRLLKNRMENLGRSVGRNPKTWALTSLLVWLMFSTGLQNVKYVTDKEFLFVPENARGLDERRIVEQLFPMDYSKDYVKGYETRFDCYVFVIIKAKEGSTNASSLFHQGGLLETASRIDSSVQELKVHTELHGALTHEDVCARSRRSGGARCRANEVASLAEKAGRFRSGDAKLTYPTYDDPYDNLKHFVPSFLGNVSLRGPGIVADAGAARLAYVLDGSSRPKMARARIWERSARSFVLNRTWSEDFDVLAVDSGSLDRELAENIGDAISYTRLAVVLVSAFTVANALTMGDWDRSLPLVTLMGLANTALSVAGGWGLLIYATDAYPWQAINLASVFLLLGVGMDDTFVMVGAYRRHLETDARCAEAVMSRVYGDAAISITLTSVTNIVSFGVGAALPGFRCVRIFCTYTAVGLSCVFVSTLTFYGAIIGWSYSYANDSSVACNVLASWLFRATKSRFASSPSHTVFGEWLPAAMTKPYTTSIVGLAMLAYWAVSSYYICQIVQGLEMSRIGRYNSPVSRYYETEDSVFRTMQFHVHVCVNGSLDYSDLGVRSGVAHLLARIRSLPSMSSDESLAESWMDQYVNNSVFYDPSDFLSGLRRFLDISARTPLPLNVKMSRDKIMATRFFLHSESIADAMQEVAFVAQLRTIAAESSYDVTTFHSFFPFVDQYADVMSNTIKCFGVSTVITILVTFALMPNYLGSLIVTASIISIEVGVAGLMSAWGIYLDTISMISLIMCVGFSVDFCAHITNHFFSPGAGEGDDFSRLRSSLVAYGQPILQGGVSTILAVVPLFCLNSYILHTFAKMMVLVVVLGIAHGLLVLPVLFSFVSCRENSRKRGDGEMPREIAQS